MNASNERCTHTAGVLERNQCYPLVCECYLEHCVKWIYFSIAALPFMNPFLLVGSRKRENGTAEICASVLPYRKGRINIREFHELTFSVEVFFLVLVYVYDYLSCSITDQGIS